MRIDRPMFVFFVLMVAMDGFPAVAGTTLDGQMSPLRWLIGTWQCQLTMTDYGALTIAPVGGGRSAAITYDFDGDRGHETLSYDSSAKSLKLAGTQSGTGYTHAWTLHEDHVNGHSDDVTFTGTINTIQSKGKTKQRQFRVEFILADDILAQWRSIASLGKNDWRTLDGVHCSQHGRPNGIEY